MKQFRPFMISLFFLLTVQFGYSQATEVAEEIIRQRIEELSAKTETEYDFSELYEHFMNLYEHPININSANAEDLRRLLFLNDNLIAILIDHRRKKGDFQSIYGLKDLDGFYIEMIKAIEPFITFEVVSKPQKVDFGNMLKYGKNQVMIRWGTVIEPQKGYTPISDSALAESPNSRYLGDKNKVYLRYKYTYRDQISFGFLGDKDAGEEFFTGSNPYGFDFYSAHFFIKNQGKLKALAVGDYHVEFGQGLTMWSGMAFGKSVTSINVQRQARGLRANTSANEVLFFRGAAATYSLLSNLDLTAFYSNKGMDAGLSIRDTADFEDLVFSGIQESGLHRTPSEVAKKQAVNEQVFGANINYNNNGFRVGMTSYKTIYDRELFKDIAPYQFYDFQGTENFNIGIDASYANRYLSVFGEMATSANKGKALLVGSIFNLHPRLTFSVLYRNYQKDYQNFYAVPISEGGKAQNEEGIYFGAQFQIGAYSNVMFYYDVFQFPWMRYRINSPTGGNEFSAQFERNPNRNLQYYFRYQFEDKMLNLTDADVAILEVTNRQRHNFRINLKYKVNSKWRLQSRLSFSRYQQKPLEISEGYLLFQDVQYSLEKIPLKLSFRYAVFNTDDYDSRIYAYESDVLYKFSVPAYYYKGQRYYLLANYDLSESLSFWVRYSQTVYNNRSIIGSGLEEIDGNTKSEITVQLRWKF